MGTVIDEALKATAEKVAQVWALRSPEVAQFSEHFAVGAFDVLVWFRRDGSGFLWEVVVVQRLPQGPVQVCTFGSTGRGITMRATPLLAGVVAEVQQALVQVMRPGWD